eukprot:1132914-Pelagomonas_calceolata.AAC.3
MDSRSLDVLAVQRVGRVARQRDFVVWELCRRRAAGEQGLRCNSTVLNQHTSHFGQQHSWKDICAFCGRHACLPLSTGA